MSAVTEQQQSQLNELRVLSAERATATGSRKGVLTKKIGQLTRQLEEQGIDPSQPAQPEKPKPRKTTKFDSALIVEKAATANDAEQLAAACGYELDANLRRRISWLVKHDQVLDAKFLSVAPRPSKKQPAQQEQPVAA